MPKARNAAGTLVLVVGASGVGKDALLSRCRAHLVGTNAVTFPRRTITRPAGDGNEDHESLSEAEFKLRKGEGAYAVSWRAHGLSYGVPVSVEDELAAGRTVVVNASRSVIDTARKRYRSLVIVLVTAPADVIASRLRSRERESESDIVRRLARAARVEVSGPDVIRIDNSGPVDVATAALLRLLREVTSSVGRPTPARAPASLSFRKR